MKFVPQEPNARVNLNQAPIGSGAYTIDFLETHAELSTEFWRSPWLRSVLKEMCELAACQRRSVERVRRLEQSFCWLVGAAVLTACGILCLQHFTAQHLISSSRTQICQSSGWPSGLEFRQPKHEADGL